MSVKNEQVVFAAAGEMAAKGSQLLHLVRYTEVDSKAEQALLAAGKAAAVKVGAIVATNIQDISEHCDDHFLRNNMEHTAETAAQVTRGFLSCIKVLAPCINSPLCQEQLIQICKVLCHAIRKLVLVAEPACMDNDSLRELHVAETAIINALKAMLQELKLDVQSEAKATETVLATVVTAIDSLLV